MDSLCQQCVSDAHLKRYIEQQGELIDVCGICESQQVKAVEQDAALTQLVRALVRFYFDEWDYNTHDGGTDIETLIWDNRELFSDRFFAHEDPALDFLSSALREGYYDYDKGISLYSGHSNGRNPPFPAIQFSHSKFEQSIVRLSASKRYGELLQSIAQTIDYCEQHIRNNPTDLVLYRARIGIAEEGYDEHDFQYRRKKYFRPFQDKEIGVAPVTVASKGRMNREGFSFLYASEDPNTAVHEIRPAPGDQVSVGAFNQVQPLVIADFTRVDLLDFFRSDASMAIFEELYHLNRLLSHAVGTQKDFQYLYTQLLAEELIRRGFDGIRFSSSLTNLANYAVFSTEKFAWDPAYQAVGFIEQFFLKYRLEPVMVAGRRYTKY